MPLNLVQHRGEPSVWDRVERREWDSERWLAGMLAGAFIVAGLRRRSVAGLLFVIGGGSLGWWAAAGSDERIQRRGRLRAALPSRSHRASDPVVEASEESFPARDAPAWPPPTGNTSTCAPEDTLV